MTQKEQLAVMFSGGTDSSYAVLSQIPFYRKIRLITFFRHGLRKQDNPSPMVKRLKQAFPKTGISWEQVNFESI